MDGHLYASTEEAKQMLRDALRDPPGRETVIRSSHQRRMSGPLSRLVNYPGWIGQHTREEAEGALENGTRGAQDRLAPARRPSGRCAGNRAGFGDRPLGALGAGLRLCRGMGRPSARGGVHRQRPANHKHRGLFLHYLDKAFAADELNFFSAYRHLHEPEAFRRHLAPAYNANFAFVRLGRGVIQQTGS
jgi:hypothetical protein